jgi:hypothetical protein
VAARLVRRIVALGEYAAPPWGEREAKGASKEVVQLAGELGQGAPYLGRGYHISSLPCLEDACYAAQALIYRQDSLLNSYQVRVLVAEGICPCPGSRSRPGGSRPGSGRPYGYRRTWPRRGLQIPPGGARAPPRQSVPKYISASKYPSARTISLCM